MRLIALSLWGIPERDLPKRSLTCQGHLVEAVGTRPSHTNPAIWQLVAGFTVTAYGVDCVARSAYECGDLWRVDPRVSTARQYWRPWDSWVGRCRCLNLGEYLMDL